MLCSYVMLCYGISWAERIRQALTVKEDGNTRYRAGSYSGAIGKYRTAMSKLQQQTATASSSADDDIAVTEPTDEELHSINSLLVDCHNNLAGIIAYAHSIL